MATETWPATLPQQLRRQGYRQARGDNRIITPTETGPPKRRRRSTAAIGSLRGSMTLSYDQVQTLSTFYDDTLNDGVDSFNFPDPLGIEPDDPNDPFPTIDVFFRSPLSWGSNGAKFTVTLNLAVNP